MIEERLGPYERKLLLLNKGMNKTNALTWRFHDYHLSFR